METNRLLLIGWDAADWQMIHPLIDAGRMPHLKGLVEGGVSGNLLTLQPILSPVLWTSIATGKRAYDHGITGFVEPTADHTALQPAQSTSRRCKALWNILSQAGKRCHAVGWLASHPAESIRGVAVSSQFPVASAGATPENWAVPAQSVEPFRWAETLAELRLHPREITPDFLRAFIPQVEALNRGKPIIARLLDGLAKRVAECLSLHAVTTDLMTSEPWDFCTVYLEAIDQLGHDFMDYHPPRLERIPPEIFELFRGVMAAAYEMHDQMLGTLLALAGPDTTVMIVSDHGFLSDHRRPDQPVDAAQWHRNFGVFAARGPGLKQDTIVQGATLLDIAPTVLTLLGLPVGQDMEGKVLVTAFAEKPGIRWIPSWEAVADPDARAGSRPPAPEDDPAVAAEVLRHLVELGYIEAPGEDIVRDIARARAEQRYNLAASLMEGKRCPEALRVLTGLITEFPGEVRHRVLYAQVAVAAGDAAALERGIAGLAGLAPENRQLPLFHGFLAWLRGDAAGSARWFLAASEQSPDDPWIHCRVGRALLRQRRWAEAERAFLRAVELDRESPEAYYGLSVALPRQGRLEEGVAHGLSAVALLHDFPLAHFQLGAVLTRLGWYERAVQAFEICVAMRPHLSMAHAYLARVYPRIGRPDLGARARAAVARIRQDQTAQPVLD